MKPARPIIFRTISRWGGWLLAAMLVLPGCTTTRGNADWSGPIPDPGVILAVTYENFAWGYQHVGKYVAPDGRVATFRYTANDPPWRRTVTMRLGSITEANREESPGEEAGRMVIEGLQG